MNTAKKAFFIVPVLSALSLGGCATSDWMNTKTIATGALVGAAVGTGLGVGVAAIADTSLWTGAIVGAGVGGALGAAGGAAADQPLY